jgi:hypothetical protein
VQVRIGVQLVPKELVIETSLSADEVERTLAAALAAADGIFSIKDNRSGRVVIPARNVGYLEIEEEQSRQVGFGTL